MKDSAELIRRKWIGKKSLQFVCLFVPGDFNFFAQPWIAKD
jgi:hypothetical protein